MMTFKDKLNQNLKEARALGIAESPLQGYVHEVGKPFHMRKNSSDMWGRMPPEKQALFLDFHKKYNETAKKVKSKLEVEEES
jgi:hypothetical protein